MAKKKADADGAAEGKKEEKDSRFSQTERAGRALLLKIQYYIKDHKGQFLQGEDGSLHLVLEGRRIPLKYDRNDPRLASLLIEACDVTDLAAPAQAAIRRLQVAAHKRAGQIRMKRFSGLSSDGERLYIPISGSQLLQISAQNTPSVTNGDNEDHFWVEHPYDSPLKYVECDPAPGLAARV